MLQTLRSSKKNGKLDPEKVSKLESMGMVWDKTVTFEDRIAPLVAYYEECGTLANIKRRDIYQFNDKVVNIGKMLQTLRSSKKNGKLDPEEIRKLESMGIVWDKRDFEDRIAPLVAYYEEHGTIANIKTGEMYTFNGEDFNIGVLINNLRQGKKRNKLDPEEIRKLESMGMVWSKKESSSQTQDNDLNGDTVIV